MQSHRSRPRTGRHALACAIAALALLHETRPALAATVEWVGGSGSWSDAAHWSGSFVPPAGFAAVLGVQSAPTPSVTVNFNYAYDQSAGLTQLVINSTGIPGVFTLLQTGLGTTMVASSEIIGDTISGNVYDQRAGDNFTTTLVLGNRSGGDGRYLLSGTGNLHVDTLQVGLAGSGAFSQDGVNSSVFAKQVGIGFGNGAASNYTLAGGSLNIANGGTLAIQPARGSFTQTGGSVSFSGTSGLFISTTAAAAGPAYTLSGGAIVGAAYETIGFNIASGTATFAQLAGSNTLAAGGVLTVGDNSAGMYRMAGGTLSTQTLALGNQGGGNGVFAQTGGNVTLTAGGELDIGKAAASSGLYTIDNQPVTNGSTLQAAVIKVGVAGNGSFRQSNGSVSTTTLTLADATGSTGSYTLNGGALQVGSASAAGTLFVGLSGGGTFTQTAGAVTVIGGSGNEGQVQIGRSASASSTYFLKGGNLNADSVLVGTLGGGTFLQSGGFHTVGGSGLFVGYGGAGGYDLSTDNAAATLNATIVTVGASNTGRFDQRGNATSVVSQALRVGFGSGGNGTYNMLGGTLDAAALQVGFNGGNGSVAQTGGSATVRAGGVQLGSARGSGNYRLDGGTLIASGVQTNPTGSFTQTGGSFFGALHNDGTFNYSGGSFSRQLDNGPTGLVNISGSLIAGGGVINRGSITLNAGSTLSSGAAASLDNEVMLTLNGGALGGAGGIVNNGSLNGFGSIAGGGGFTNNGVWTVGVGNLVLANSGSNINVGILELGAGRQLQLSGAALSNSGTLALNAGLITGSGTLTNATGGVLSGVGTVTAALVNRGVIVPGNGAVVVTQGFSNLGVVNLSGPFSSITGGAINNSGTLQGAGNVGAAVNNSGTVEAIGGTLVVTGAISNNSTGRLAAGSGAKLLAQGGVANNAGLIVLSGGNFDSGTGSVNNSGQITGFGNFSSGGLVNAGSVNLTGGNTTVNGAVTNNAGRTLQVAYNPATFTGLVTNNGTLHTIATTVVFAGGFVNNGLLASDPSTLRFNSLTVNASGSLNTGAGDVYEISSNFVNLSAQSAAWDTHAASLLFNGSGSETLVLAGHDLGANAAGYEHNFAWGRVEVVSGASLAVSSAFGNNALYAGAFVLDGGLAQIAHIHSSANLYYDASLNDNAYLGGATYALAGGGVLAAAVPEPASWLLLAGGLIWVQRRTQPRRTHQP